jgi:hypothetical protein
VDDENRLRIRDVAVIRAGVDAAVIADGLRAGERIVTSNLQYVTEGLPVRLEGQPAAPASTAGDTAERDAGKDGA